MNKTLEQWALVDAGLCASQNSVAANQYLISDAKQDISILGNELSRLRTENEEPRTKLVSQWIKCSERLPEIGEPVLIRIPVCDHWNVEGGSYQGGAACGGAHGALRMARGNPTKFGSGRRCLGRPPHPLQPSTNKATNNYA